MSRNRSRNVVLAFFVALVFALVSHAQAPTSRVIHYDNVQTDVLSTPGQPFRLQLFDMPTGGTLRYCEDQALDTDATGLISFDFGAGTPSTPPCPSSPPGLNPNDFTAGESRYLDVVDPSAGTSHLTARVPVKAVGFAVNPGPQGPQGIQGLQGVQGPPGVVQTVTAAPGDTSITVSGTAADRVLSIANGALSPAKITGTAATLGSNVFNGGQTVIGDIAPVHVLSGSDIIVGDNPNRAFPDSRSVYIENSAGDPRNSLRLDGFFDHLVIAADSAPGALAGAALQFRTAPAGGGELQRMEIAPNGNVGINTITPQFKLDVAGDTRVTGAIVFGDGTRQTSAPFSSGNSGSSNIVIPNQLPAETILSQNLSAGTFIAFATVHFTNATNPGQQIVVRCFFNNEGITFPYRFTLPSPANEGVGGATEATETFHTIITTTGGAISLSCVLDNGTAGRVFAFERRITAVRIAP